MMKVMIAYANSLGDRWGAWIVVALLESALLLALVGLLWSVIRTRVAPQVGYGLFLLVPLKLLVPITVTVPAAVACWTPAGLASSWFHGGPVAVLAAVPSLAGSPSLVAQARPLDSAGPRLESSSLPLSPFDPVSRRSLPPASPVRDADESEAAAVTGGPAPDVVVEGSRLSAGALVMIAWLVGIVLLLARLVHSQLRFRAQLRRVSPLDESRLAIDLRELCRLAGVSESIPIMEHATIAAPAVWGIARPVILFPQGLASMLSSQQLRWVLLHELAHVRRLDLIVVALQRGVAILHFFNPALWVANRMIHRLREYACDDRAATLSRASAVESGEAFLRILRYAGRSRPHPDGTLGVFGLDSRASCFRRIHRLLDTERPIRTAPGAWSLWGLILLAVVSLPHLRASEDDARPRAGSEAPAKGATLDQAGSKVAEKGEPAKAEFSFTLRVVGLDGKPVPEAVVDIRTKPLPSAEQIRGGTFVKQGSYGTTVKTDAEGSLVVRFPRMPQGLNVGIMTSGYGPYWARWSSQSHVESIPTHFTAELDAGWSVGGIIVDAAGKPVEGATVHPSIEYKKRPGDYQQLGIGSALKTDAAGKWRFDSVPVAMGEVHVAIDHPNFGAVRRPLSRGEFGLERGREPASKVVMEPGLSVTGRVTDEAGAPIVGALVRTKFVNESREARTGEDGGYKLVGCEPRSTRLVVSAKGWATDMKELNVEPEMGPVDFRMKPGGTVRIRVLDAQGQPVPRARIFFQRWRGPFSYFEFDHVSQYADKEGVWIWNEAPLDEFQADICSNTGMDLTYRPLISRAEEYVFRLPPALVVTGKVFDAVTKEPIQSFRVVPGARSSDSQLSWAQWQAFSASDGRFQLRKDRESFAHLVRVEADGYRSLASRDIKSDEGNVAIDFAMTRAKGVVAKVVTPRNLPAAGAKIALGLAGSQISLLNGDIDDRSTHCAREVTDQAGRFHFPAQDKDFQLIITHPSGYAHIRSSPEWERARIIRLEPWARVEGTFRVGKRPGANAPIALHSHGLQSYGVDVPRIFASYDVTADPDGRFVFDRVASGRGSIGRRIMLTVEDGATEVTSSGMIAMEFPGGKTTHVELGGTGRPVVGTLQPPGGFLERVRWNFALVKVAPAADERGGVGSYFTAAVDRDGRFRIDDVPPGDYLLNVRFDRPGPGQLLDRPIEVPPPGEGKEADAPVDLGSLRLEPR